MIGEMRERSTMRAAIQPPRRASNARRFTLATQSKPLIVFLMRFPAWASSDSRATRSLVVGRRVQRLVRAWTDVGHAPEDLANRMRSGHDSARRTNFAIAANRQTIGMQRLGHLANCWENQIDREAAQIACERHDIARSHDGERIRCRFFSHRAASGCFVAGYRMENVELALSHLQYALVVTSIHAARMAAGSVGRVEHNVSNAAAGLGVFRSLTRSFVPAFRLRRPSRNDDIM